MPSLYNAVASRDILNRERALGASRVTDAALLRRITALLAGNVGNKLSPSRVAGALTSAGTRTTNKTVGSYAGVLDDAYLFYKADRYDLHGGEILRTNPERYVVDLGLRSFLGGYWGGDAGRTFENAVYLQLLYGGWNVYVGKLCDKEVDFVAVRDGRVAYIQVTDEMLSEGSRERELAPLLSIRDAHEKLVVVRQGRYEPDADGVKIVGAMDFFLEWGRA